MQILVVGDNVGLRIWCSDAEQASVNTVWYTVAAVGSPPATNQDVADQFEPFLAPLYKAILNNNATFDGVQVLYVRNPPPLPPGATVFNNADAGAGTAGASALPRQVAGIGTFHTNLAGRAYRGRIYLPFPAAADDTGDGSPSAGYLTRTGAIVADLGVGIAIAMGGRTATLVRSIKHRKNKAGVIPPDTPVTSYLVQSKWATQRRRGDYGRANSSPI